MGKSSRILWTSLLESQEAKRCVVDVGTVLAVQGECNSVLVESAKKDLWYYYLHIIPKADLVRGQSVLMGSTLGTVKDNPSACGQYGNPAHVHLALITPTGPYSGNYVTFQDRYICGHRVIRNGSNANIIIEGLTIAPHERFEAPICD